MNYLFTFMLFVFCTAVAKAPNMSQQPQEQFLAAMLKARKHVVMGESKITVRFPPRQQPHRTAKTLPNIHIRPWLIKKNFKITITNPQKIAGRPTHRYELTPKTGPAPRWVFWIDQEWNVPLAFEERQPDGTLTRSARIKKINTLTKMNRKVPKHRPSLRKKINKALPGVQYPQGFIPVGIKERPQGEQEVTLTDGINKLALMIATRNVTNAPGIVSRKVEQQFIWLVGNLPKKDLRKTLESVTQVKRVIGDEP